MIYMWSEKTVDAKTWPFTFLLFFIFTICDFHSWVKLHNTFLMLKKPNYIKTISFIGDSAQSVELFLKLNFFE